MSHRIWQAAGLAAALCAVLAATGCSPKSGSLIGNQRPTVQLSARPQQLSAVKYSVRLQWFSFDPDGRVDYFLWSVDPPAGRDTVWTRYTRSDLTLFFKSSEPDSASITYPFPPTSVTSRDFHVFVIKAVDNEGAPSAPEFVAFTSTTVAPTTSITDPPPNETFVAPTAPSVNIVWTGIDPDGVITQKPVKYKFKLASKTVIQQALNLGALDPNAANIQEFFFRDAPTFAGWDSVPPDSAHKQYEGLTPGQEYYFAVCAFDEAGAYEPRFRMGNNVLHFKPALQLAAPKLTVYNSFFSRTQPKGAFDLSESRVVHIEVAETQPVPFFWFAEPVSGTVIAGYRWALDIQDVFSELPRTDESQTDRWSTWSVSETSALVGPFYVTADTDRTVDPPLIVLHDTHRFYVEARDNVGSISIMIIEMKVVPATFKTYTPDQRKFLVFDDFAAGPDRFATHFVPYGPYPTEAVMDTLLYARGGFAYGSNLKGQVELAGGILHDLVPSDCQYRPGQLSDPGVFAGFTYDTLDYRFIPVNGLPLSIMVLYNSVVWYSGLQDAANKGDHFSTVPEGALRLINRPGQLNTLAVYLSEGGNAWLFGDGMLQSIANGYVLRFPVSTPAGWPYASTGTAPSATSILWPGDFLYDYLKIHSQVDHVNQAGAGDRLTDTDNLYAMTPYLPEYRTPGAPWPPEGWTGGRGPTDDPRVGPASSRNVARWEGLPMLTFTQEFADWPSPLPLSTDAVPYVSIPNVIEEPEAPAFPRQSVLDTLYLYRAGNGTLEGYRIHQARDWPDGKPVWFHYWGTQHGQVDWTGAPIWYFDRTQLRTVADKIMAQFDFYRNPNPLTWTGPGGVPLRELGIVGEVPAIVSRP